MDTGGKRTPTVRVGDGESGFPHRHGSPLVNDAGFLDGPLRVTWPAGRFMRAGAPGPLPTGRHTVRPGGRIRPVRRVFPQTAPAGTVIVQRASR